MKIVLALAIALRATATAGAQDSSTARVCLVRHEDGGRMNLLAARIYGSHGGAREELLATLVGGSEKCVTVKRGSWLFESRSSRPYAARAGNPNACGSEPLRVEVAMATTIVVAPQSKRSTYACGWKLRLREEAAQPAP